MKKQILILAVLFITAGIYFTSCKKDDTGAPVITLKGDATHVVTFNSASTYTDPGYTAEDAEDGDVTANVTVTGTVVMQSAGEYTLEYSVTDDAGNVGTASRTVIVDAAPYLAGTTWSEVDTLGTQAFPATAGVVIVASSAAYNRIIVNGSASLPGFAGFVNANCYINLSGTSTSMPSQTYTCGSDNQPRTFVSTTGQCQFIPGAPIKMVIHYTITQTGVGTINCVSWFTKN
ncbi:MAG: DUF5011 domain-containing protein [Bacteroidales bacterium]|nr:DUF5011 domain-containing protein [Bacteroidales bacterium]